MTPAAKVTTAFICATLLHGCASLQDPAVPVQSAPRLVNTTKVTVVKSNAPRITQTGHASWYGPGFHGRKTASGVVFDQTELTAAHRNLPLGSKVRVTNLENAKSVEVEINDRGPFVPGRIIDLSRAAARVLGMLEDGITRVRVELVALPNELKLE